MVTDQSFMTTGMSDYQQVLRSMGDQTLSGIYVKFYTGLPIRSTYSLEDMANDGLAVLDHLSIDKSHLVGMSMGGMISQHLASNNEERFYSLTLIASMAKHVRRINSTKRTSC